MTKTTKIWIAGLGVMAVLALALPSIVVAQHGDGDRGGHEKMVFKMKGGGGDWVHASLDLTEEQQSQVDELRLEYKQAQLRLKGKISAAEAELEALMLDPEASRAAVLAAGAELQELRGQAAAQRLEHRMDFRALLTPEQRAELVKKGSRLHGMHGLHGEHGMHGGYGIHGRQGMHGRHGRGQGEHGRVMRWIERDAHGDLHEIELDVVEEEGESL